MQQVSLKRHYGPTRRHISEGSIHNFALVKLLSYRRILKDFSRMSVCPNVKASL